MLLQPRVELERIRNSNLGDFIEGCQVVDKVGGRERYIHAVKDDGTEYLALWLPSVFDAVKKGI